MKLIILILLLTLTCGVGIADADFAIDQIPVLDSDCTAPSIASSDDGLTMVSFTANGVLTMSFVVTQLMPTHPGQGVPWPDPVTVSAGSSSKLRWSRDGFTLAVSSGPMILLYQSDLAGNWDFENYTVMDPGGEVLGMDLWGTPGDAAGPAVFLTWQSSQFPSNPGARVYYASRSAFGWSERELVAEVDGQLPHPQITWSLGPAGPWPTIFYLTGDSIDGTLLSTTRDLAAGWSEPIAVPGDGVSTPTSLGGEFDVVSPFHLDRHILGLGPQPACPCGSLHHQYYTPGAGWHSSEEVSVPYLFFDWPMSPCMDGDLDGNVHAFWFQLASSPELEPHLKTLEYWIWDGGVWTDAGDWLDDQAGGPLGSRVALDVSPAGAPVLAWTRRDTLEGVPQPEQVWIARQQDPSGVLQDQVPGPGAVLKAWPNPFNPRVNLAIELDEAGHVRLEIFDARGRLVSSLMNGDRPAGRHALTWSGRNAGGTHQPSGVYFARLVTAKGTLVQKVVLAR